MPFTLVHGLIGFVAAWLLFKEFRLALVGFFSGMLPDLDGLPILFDRALYLQAHHELFHPPIYGLLLAIPAALIAEKYWGLNRKKTFVAFFAGFLLHSITDVFFTSWYVRLLWPFSQEKFLFSGFTQFNLLLVLVVGLATLAIVFVEWKKKEKSEKNEGKR